MISDKDPSKEALAARRLTYAEVKTLVKANKKSAAFTNECVIAVCWKESSFNPDATNPKSTSKGLMQMTDGAVDTVNKITPNGVHFAPSDMLTAEKAIQCGTYYLQWCSDQKGGDKNKALDKFGGLTGYSKDVVTAETCLLGGPADPMTCLTPIHSFQLTRTEEGLIDDPTGASRFSKEK